MRLFVNNYCSDTTREMSVEEFEELLFTFDREIGISPIQTRIDYAQYNPQDESLAKVLRQVDPSKTVVMHFDCDLDVYIEA